MKRLPVGVPSNYRELFAEFGPVLAESARGLGMPLEELQASVRGSKVVELFNSDEHFPITLTWPEACAVTGMNDDQWHTFLRNTKKPPKGSDLPWSTVRPTVIRGREGEGPAEPWDDEAVYWGSDILRAIDFMDTHNIRRKKAVCPPIVLAFATALEEFIDSIRRAKIAASAKTLNNALAEIESSDDWPEDLPRDSNQLAKMYGEYVYDQIRRISKIKTDDELDEVNQQVWMSLLHSRVLDKFVAAAKTKLPRTLTVTEVLGYLGITLSQWTNSLAYASRTDSVWMPLPVKGTATSKDALYLTEDIQTLDNSGFLEGRRNAPRQHPEFSGRGFKSYLTQAIKNHFKNLLRTRSRRHKERCVDDKAVLTPNTVGTYHKAYVSEEDVRWEENLADTTGLDMEDLLDLKSALDRNGVNPVTAHGVDVLDHMQRGLTVKAAVRYQQKQTVRVTG